jgi:hypothetical protein
MFYPGVKANYELNKMLKCVYNKYYIKNVAFWVWNIFHRAAALALRRPRGTKGSQSILYYIIRIS